MNHEVRMELTRQLEKIKFASQGPNANWLYLTGTIAEILGGVAFVSWAIRLIGTGEDLILIGYGVLIVGVLVLGHAAYLSFNRFMNRKLRFLYEAVLDTSTSEQISEQAD